MCGIFCSILLDNKRNIQNLSNELKMFLENRGPDAHDELLLNHTAGNILFSGFVLWQQGDNVQTQPVCKNEFVILFNGDLFNIEKPVSMSDTSWLADKIGECNSDEEIITLLRFLEGPHCLIIYDKRSQAIYFSRDVLGRNSLIIERSQDSLNLISTSYHNENGQLCSIELPPLGLYRLNVNDLSTCELYPWQINNEYSLQLIEALDRAMVWKTIIKGNILPTWLINQNPIFDYNFYRYAYTDECKIKLFDNLTCETQIKLAIDNLHELLCMSIAPRVTKTPPFCRICLKQRDVNSVCKHAKVCILFSGGIDCTILALLAHKYIPEDEPIELINVAFQRFSAPSTCEDIWNVPDRQTSLISVNELKRLCPHRRWNILNVNVTRCELSQMLSTHIKHLIYPLRTILDESLGCAFWFASHSEESTSRVALLGSGADELFGGYTRHRNSYKRCQGDESNRQRAVQNELDLDWQRIPARNLARDDRVIADNGKTARCPFIEENLIAYLRSLKSYQKCCFSFPEGVGDKLLLRLYGYTLGLRNVPFLKKRAIQFGSRIANKKNNASNFSDYL
ncbi:hypothetical protein KR018_002187, partial [Drosophila ironensis]